MPVLRKSQFRNDRFLHTVIPSPLRGSLEMTFERGEKSLRRLDLYIRESKERNQFSLREGL